MTTPQWTMPRDVTRLSTLEASMLAQIHAAGLPEPVLEHQFDRCCDHPKKAHGGNVYWECFGCTEDGRPSEVRLHAYRRGRAWRLDIAYPELKVAVECEGGVHTGGRHTRGTGFEEDCRKYNEAALQGWLIIRATASQIDDGTALEWLERALAGRA